VVVIFALTVALSNGTSAIAPQMASTTDKLQLAG